MMYNCQICQSNNWTYSFNDEDRMVTAVCVNCNNKVTFPAKPKKYNPNKVHAQAKYKHENKDTFLEINGEYKKVGVFKDEDGYLQVKPLHSSGQRIL